MAITENQLSRAWGASTDIGKKWAGVMSAAMAVFAIDTPNRAAAFLAQCGHESGRGRYTREIWGPTPAQARYEGRADLGNTQPGDGKRFMGRGLIQTTGRANYCATRDGLRKFVPDVPDFEAMPQLLEQSEWAALSAAWHWHSRGLNALADVGDFRRITIRVNGGTNGMADRLALWAKAKEVMGVAA